MPERRRIFLLSPANVSGERARMLLRPEAGFDLALRLRGEGAPIGEAFAFISGLYFRGKLAYAKEFAVPPEGIPGSFVITSGYGLVPPETPVTLEHLRQIGGVPIDAADPRYREPLERACRTLDELAGPACDFVLLGSVATTKYLEPMFAIFGDRLLYPAEFAGRGDMSRGGLLLRCARAGVQLTYIPLGNTTRHGPRPEKLPRAAAQAARLRLIPHAGARFADNRPMPANKNRNRLILVTGATGQQGSAALRHLVERGFSVRALTRDPDQPKSRALTGRGAEVMRGNMEDEASLTRALDGVYGVFSVQNSHQAGIEGEVRQGIHLADAAKRSRITHFVYTSVGSADQRTGIPHFESKYKIEEHVRASGMHFTIVRPVFFMENWLGMREGIQNGTFAQPLDPATRLQMIAVDDIGGIVATAFEHPGKWQDRTFDLAGDELSMAELTQTFSRITGREVRYVQIPWDEFESRAGKDLTLMYRWFQDTGYHVDIPAARQEYPKLTTFDRWLNSHWHSGTRTAG